MSPQSKQTGRSSPLSRARRLVRRSTPDEDAVGPAGDDTAPTTGTPAEITPELPAAARPAPRRQTVTSARPDVHPDPEADAEHSDPDAEHGAPDAAEAESVESASRAGRNLPVAIGVGVALGALIFASLFLYRPSFAYVVGAAALYGTYELSRAFRTVGIRISLGPLLVGGAALLVAAWLRGPSGLVLAALVTVAGVAIWRIADGAHGYTRDVAASLLALLYVPTLAGFAVLLTHPHDGAGRVIAFVATVVCSDTGGYAAGVLFGKHPLAPVVSKAKTWEGFAGSVLACSAAGILFMMFLFHHSWWKGLLFGAAIVVTATLGDLGESMMKRDLGIKDMGRLLPGHGGIMDRLDSLLPCAAVAYLVLTAFAPT